MLTLACFNPLTPLNTWLHHTSPPSCLSGSRWSEKKKEKASQLPRWRRCKGRSCFACCFPAICLSSLMVLWCYNEFKHIQTAWFLPAQLVELRQLTCTSAPLLQEALVAHFRLQTGAHQCLSASQLSQEPRVYFGFKRASGCWST